MGNINYTYRYRIYPNEAQQQLLAKMFGCTRFVYNHFLNERNVHYLNNKESQSEAKKSLSYLDNAKSLTELKKQEKTSFLKEANSQSLQATLKQLDGAFLNFFAKRAKFPKFKSKHSSKQSFKIPQHITIENNKIYFPKFKEGINIVLHRPYEGRILSCTVSKNASNQYYVSLCVEREAFKPLLKTNKAVGIDLGIKTLVVCSDGKTYENPKTYKKYKKQLAQAQKHLSRKQKGSNRRRKQKLKVAKLHNKISNIRSNTLHKITSDLIQNNDVIICEDLNVKGMIKNHKLASALTDASFSELVRQLEYKANYYGRTVVKIDRFFPSSKTCVHCGFINQNLKLKDRNWTCANGHKLDRDLNASQVILKQGLNLLEQHFTDVELYIKTPFTVCSGEASKILNKEAPIPLG